jgi:hypothetical protein
MINPQAHPFDQGSEVPGVDRLAVDRGLMAHRVEPGAVGPGRGERVVREGSVEPGDSAGGALEGRGGGTRQSLDAAVAIVVPHDFWRCRPSNGRFIGATVSVRAAVGRSRMARCAAECRASISLPRAVFGSRIFARHRKSLNTACTAADSGAVTGIDIPFAL